LIHLHVRSWFSFLAAGSSPEELAQRAAQLGQPALALTDLHGFYGAVRFARACKAVGVRPLFGVTLMLSYPDEKPAPVVMLAENREGYADLCRLCSRFHQQGGALHWQQLQAHNVVLLTGGWESRLDQLLLQRKTRQAREWLAHLMDCFPDSLYVELAPSGRPGDRRRLEGLLTLAQQFEVPCILSNAVRYATPQSFPRYDALCCVRLGLTVGDPHPERPVNDRACLCSAEELFAQLSGSLEPYMQACEQTQRVALRCQLDLLPEFVTPPTALLPAGVEPDLYLRQLCQQGIVQRYRRETMELRARAEAQLEHELNVVQELELAEFFLVVREVTEFARVNGIRYAGRGSAANSIIAYLLGITTVDPLVHRLLFERFLHRGRRGMPDIDVDFDSERRPEVIAWMEARFGEEHAAMTATVHTYQAKGALREMMKVLGWDPLAIDAVCKPIGQWDTLDSLRARRAEIEAVVGCTPLIDVLYRLVESLQHCPRHLSLHNGGMVLTRKPLAYFSPIQTSTGGYRQVQFDKDDVESLGLIKFDVLGLRMLAVLSEAVQLHYEDSGEWIELDELPMDDGPSFELIRSGQTMSLFQIESPGQMSLLARTQPRTFSDLVTQVALFRPGPLQGGMVSPYLKRRAGLLETTYPHPSLAPVLEDTHGIIVFQEQVLEICHQFAGLSLDEADEFRRLMSKWRDPGNMDAMGERFIEGAREKHGVSRELAGEVFRQVAAFVGYGFCRSHAAAFARTVFHSAYLKTHVPAAYMAAVLQHKPGFFPMSTVMEEVRHLGVEILPVCILRSRQTYRVERGAVRMPFTQVREIHLDGADRLVHWQQNFAPAQTPEPEDDRFWQSLLRHVELGAEQWENLARAGAFDAICSRRRALWRVGVGRPSSARFTPMLGGERTVRPYASHGSSTARKTRGRKLAKGVNSVPQGQLPFGAAGEDWNAAPDIPVLREVSPELSLTWDYSTQSCSAQGHPMKNHRPALQSRGVRTIGELKTLQPGPVVSVAGWVIVRQRPPTAKGMTFIMLEDETARIQVAVTPQVFEQFPAVLSRASGLLVTGKLEGTPAKTEVPMGCYRSLLLTSVLELSEALGSGLFQVAD
jgi:error-prone DNA polymerase